MFGVYRTLLAIMVVTQHLAGVHVLGAYAVFGFYILSGYLMTSIMQCNYGYSPVGVGKYALNRFLRIYPMYWLSILLSVLLISCLGQSFSIAFHEAIYIPTTAYEYVRNIFIFFPVVESPRLTPPAWALTVELCFYILIGLGISRNERWVTTWLIVSVAYHLAANFLNKDWDSIYFSIPAASLPFATGAFIFHFKDRLWPVSKAAAKFIPKILPIIVFVLVLINWKLGVVSGYDRSICFYCNYLLCSLMVLLLANWDAVSFVSPKVDKWFGNLSYPIYVIHYQVGLLVMAALHYVGIVSSPKDLHILLVSLPLIFLIAWLMVIGIEQPIERIRARVRPSVKSVPRYS